MQPAPLLQLGKRYTLNERIAVGGMGEVWQARDEVLGRTVAIKILGQQFLESPEFADRFRAEARHSASLAHPGVAAVYDYAEDEDGAYLVMEFVNGEPLSALLAREHVPPLTFTLSILAQTADALAAAHEAGIIHRDVKPGNIMITPTGSAKVTDFGIARAIDSLPVTALGQVIGTPQYMSPEQASGQPVGTSSDIYSLGVVGYEALAGRRPFNEATPLALAMAHVHGQPPPLPESVPADVRDLIDRAMAKQPADRPASAEAMAGELRTLQMRLTPPPLIANDSAPATLVDSTAAPTQHMPSAGVVVGAPKIVIDRRVVSPPAKRRMRAVAPVAIVVGLACTLLIALARHDGSRTLGVPGSTAEVSTTAEPTTSPPTTTVVTEVAAPVISVETTVAPALIDVDPAAYIGQPYGAARDALRAMGFEVVQHKTKGKGHGGDTVLDVQPTGPVAPGSTITLTVSGGGKD